MFYESTFIARQDLSVTQVEALTKTYADLIGSHGGEIKDQEYWGLRPLAYPIRKNTKGHYVFFRIKAPSKAMDEFRRQIKINENIVRNLVVSVKELEEGPSAMMSVPRRERESYEGERYDNPRFEASAEVVPSIEAIELGDAL